MQIRNGEDVNAVSKRFGIPRRNLLRWKKYGCERKEGGGRPTDDDMEAAVQAKIK
jgi:transposase-like protein